MTIDFENESSRGLELDPEEIACKVAEASLDHIGCPYEVQISLLITDLSGIHQMNREFRGIDRPTDVLSFPMLEYETAGNFDFLEEDGAAESYFNPDTGELMLGDIVICADKVVQQAEEYGHSIVREYAFLVAHSMLHLMGFDHIIPEEAALMEEKQREILDGLGITR